MRTQVDLVFPAHRSLAAQRGAGGMQVVYPRCGGLDIKEKTMVAGVVLTDADGATRRLVAHL
jgi:hypothetical protein